MPKPRPAKKTETIEVRLDPGTKRGFMAACRRQNRRASEVIREFIESYLAAADRAPRLLAAKEFDMTGLLRDTRLRLAALGGCIALGAAIATPSAAADPRLEAFFQWLDTDRDSSLTPEEFAGGEEEREGEKEKETDGKEDTVQAERFGIRISVSTRKHLRHIETREQLFPVIDANKDGALSFKELQSVLVVETIVNEPILIADRNGDGAVSEAELAAHITARRARAGKADPAAGAALLARGIIGAHDGDGDGAVGPEDFKQ